MITNDQAPKFGECQCEYECDYLNKPSKFDGVLMLAGAGVLAVVCVGIYLGRYGKVAALLGLLFIGSCTQKAYHGQANAKPRAIGLHLSEPAGPSSSTSN